MMTHPSAEQLIDQDWLPSNTLLAEFGLQAIARPDVIDLEEMTQIVQLTRAIGPFVLQTALRGQSFSLKSFSTIDACWAAYFETIYESALFILKDVGVSIWCPEDHHYHIVISPTNISRAMSQSLFAGKDRDFQEYIDLPHWDA
ncbi:MAG: hypothetical protein AAFO17_17450, partial [Pseudomonadota bacterium]